MAPFQTFATRLVRSVSLSAQTKHLEFEVSALPRFGFVAGQWLSFKTNKPDGEEITRAYSIASPPGDDNRFALCLNRVQDGFMSNFLCDMKEGEEISCQGPFGDFILRPPLRDTIFIATGTGVAPFRSMLHWLLADPVRHQDKQLWLLFGNRTERDIYYHEEFLDLAAHHPNFQLSCQLSAAALRNGKVCADMSRNTCRESSKGRTDMHAYICGLDKMIKANRELLKGLGWDRKSILYEKYD